MQRDASDHRQYECDGKCVRCPMRGGEAADCHNGGEMIQADNRMAEPREDSLSKGCRRAATHQVMREGRRVAERQHDQAQTQASELSIHARFSRPQA